MTATLTQLVTDDRVLLGVAVDTWEEAVAAAAAPLVADGSIEPRYVDAIVDSAREFGPYFVLVPGVALAHARPEDGVHRLAVSIATLATPIAFGSEANDPVTVVVCLAAPGSDEHLEALRSLVGVIGDADRIRDIHAASTVDELQRLLVVG